MDIYDGADLKAEIEAGHSIQQAAQFLCRADGIDDVERKAREFGLIRSPTNSY